MATRSYAARRTGEISRMYRALGALGAFRAWRSLFARGLVGWWLVAGVGAWAAAAAAPLGASEAGGEQLAVTRFAEPEVTRFAELALACVGREYPNKIAHVMHGVV